MRTEKKEGTIAIELDFSPILSIKEKQQRDAPSGARRRRHCSDFPFSRMNEHKKTRPRTRKWFVGRLVVFVGK